MENKKNTTVTRIIKLMIYGIELIKELIAIRRPSDLDITLKGFNILATRMVFRRLSLLAYFSPYCQVTKILSKAENTITKSKILANDLIYEFFPQNKKP